MARKNKRPVFDESDSDGDNADGSFKQYLNERSAQSSKKARSSQALVAAESGLQDESPAVKVPEEGQSISGFINGLLESKKQREMDKLHAQAIRSRLENQLQKKSDIPEQVFITEGYKVKRKEYDQAELLAAEEEEQDNDLSNEKLYGGSSRSLSMRLLMSEQPYRKVSASEKVRALPAGKVHEKPLIFENDVYRAEPSITTSSGKTNNELTESLIKLGPEEKKLCIREFLRSKTSAQDIKLHIEKYNERQRQTVKSNYN